MPYKCIAVNSAHLALLGDFAHCVIFASLRHFFVYPPGPVGALEDDMMSEREFKKHWREKEQYDAAKATSDLRVKPYVRPALHIHIINVLRQRMFIMRPRNPRNAVCQDVGSV